MTEELCDSGWINDRIFLGEGLFETLKVDNFQPCFSELHWQRLNDSAHRLGISFTLSKKEWQQLLLNKIEQSQLDKGGIKAILTGGVASRGLLAQGTNNQLLIQSFSYLAQLTPLRLTSASWRRDANNPIYQLKTINYLEAIMARREAIRNGADDALFFNTRYQVTEATCANVFIIKDGCLITPPQSDGVLPGITRFRILNHCLRFAIPYTECSITAEMIFSAEAVFLTNSLQGIVYVSSVDKRQFVIKHPLVERLIALLNDE